MKNLEKHLKILKKNQHKNEFNQESEIFDLTTDSMKLKKSKLIRSTDKLPNYTEVQFSTSSNFIRGTDL